MTDPGTMRLHRDVDPASGCGGQVADGGLFGTDYWCVYCGAKWSASFRSQAARDAQAAGYGDEGYWRYLDDAALRHHAYFLEHGDLDTAAAMLDRSLAAALRGNDGD